jgi:putative ABC transport system ATP-binding protein
MNTLIDVEEMISLEHIDKRFNPQTVNETVLFEDFNFSIYKGEFVSIVGSNGSGKTTLLNLICGTIMPDSGKVILDGEDISTMPEYRRSQRIGRVFQDPAKGTCPSLSILENLSLADCKNQSYNLEKAVNKTRIDFYRTSLEKLHLGLEDKLHMPVGLLSGGQRQALAMLIATMTPIDLLVLDEHTAALDPKSSEVIMDLTEKVISEKGLTTVMVTHNLRYAVNYGTRLVMMHQGRTVIDASEELKNQYKIEDLLKVFNSISIECGN